MLQSVIDDESKIVDLGIGNETLIDLVEDVPHQCKLSFAGHKGNLTLRFKYFTKDASVAVKGEFHGQPPAKSVLEVVN